MVGVFATVTDGCHNCAMVADLSANQQGPFTTGSHWPLQLTFLPSLLISFVPTNYHGQQTLRSIDWRTDLPLN